MDDYQAIKENARAVRARNLRYKKPALANISYYDITEKLYEIECDCSEIREMDDEVILSALDDDEEDFFEFRVAFADLESEAAQLSGELEDVFRFIDEPEKYFNDMSVALLGNRFNAVGFDDYEEDYYSLTAYERDCAHTEAGKRVMRYTKAEMLDRIGHIIGVILSFHNVEMKYEYLKATFDVLRDESHSLLDTIKQIETAYERANECEFREWEKSTKEFESLLLRLPERMWVE